MFATKPADGARSQRHQGWREGTECLSFEGPVNFRNPQGVDQCRGPDPVSACAPCCHTALRCGDSGRGADHGRLYPSHTSSLRGAKCIH